MAGRLGWVGSAVGLLLFLLLAPVAQAGWLPPVDVSAAGEHVGVPDVVLDSAGNATAVWDRWDGTHVAVESAYRPAGGGWQAPVDISSATEGEGGEALPDERNAASPQIAVDGAGDLTVVWERHAGTNRILLQAVYRPAGGSWQTPVDIGEVQTMWAPEPWIAVDAQGDATAVWNDAGVIESAYRPAAGGWQAPVPISDAGSEAHVPQAAVNAQGDATAVWHDVSSDAVLSAYRPAGGSWEAPTLVSGAGEDGGNPHIALGAAGDAMVVWRGKDGGTVLRAAFRPAGGVWGEPTDVSVPGDDVQVPHVALDAEGNAIAVWADSNLEPGGHNTVLAAYQPADGSWQAPTPVSEAGENAFPSDVAFDASGNSAVVWSRDDGESYVLQAAYRPAEGAWQDPVDLSEEGEDATDAVVVLGASGESTAALGVAAVVWGSSASLGCGEKGEEAPCVDSRVRAAGYDAFDSPSAGLEVPATGMVGTPVEVSVPAANIWTPQMEFGDGSSTTATSATHAYAEPGEYTVSFTGNEVLGYPSSAQRTITILPADGPPDEHGGGEPSPPAGTPPSPSGAAQLPPTGSAAPQPIPYPSPACTAAEGARESALRQLRRTRSKIKHGHGSAVQQLRRRSRKQAAALRRAGQLADEACGDPAAG